MSDHTRLEGYLTERLPEALDWLERMVGINSFTENRDGVNRVGRLTAEAFAPLGFEAEHVPSAHPGWGDHLILCRPGRTDRSLALISHLDTVFPPEEEARNQFRWRPDGDLIYGPGTNDIKGGTVLMWLVLSALKTLHPETFAAVEWRLFWNAAEEALGDDFGLLVRRRLDADTRAALVFEGESRLGTARLMVVARKGRATWRVTARGRGAHAGGCHRQGANAIVELAGIIQRLAGFTDYTRDLTFNVGTIRGGTVTNRVPHEAALEGELRAFTPDAYAAGKSALRTLAGPGCVRSAADGYVCQVDVEILSESRPWPRNAGSDALLAHWQAAGRRLGQIVEPEERGGLSDGNALWDLVPTLDGLGPAGENAHCSEWSADGSKRPEYVDVRSLVPKAMLNVEAIRALVESSAG